jgi:hypothetical protein
LLVDGCWLRLGEDAGADHAGEGVEHGDLGAKYKNKSNDKSQTRAKQEQNRSQAKY